MRRLAGFGNNAVQNIDPENTSDYIKAPRDISAGIHCHEVVWHSWEGTIVRTQDRTLKTWGSLPNIGSTLDFDKIIGHDSPVGYLKEGRLHLFDGRHSVKAFIDVAVTGLGDVFALYDGAVHHFASINDLLEGNPDYSHSHGLFDLARLYAMESRCFVEAQNHLFEVTRSEIRLLEELEGLGIARIITGRRNRLGIITEASEAYILETKVKEPVLLELEDTEEIRLIGLGSDFDVVVTDNQVLTRGVSESSVNLM